MINEILNEIFEIIDDIQMTDNTWQEAVSARIELKERIEELLRQYRINDENCQKTKKRIGG